MYFSRSHGLRFTYTGLGTNGNTTTVTGTGTKLCSPWSSGKRRNAIITNSNHLRIPNSYGWNTWYNFELWLIDWLIDWLIGVLRGAVSQPYNGATFNKRWLGLRFWSFPGGPRKPTSFEIQRKSPLSASGGCYPWHLLSDRHLNENLLSYTYMANISTKDH